MTQPTLTIDAPALPAPTEGPQSLALEVYRSLGIGDRMTIHMGDRLMAHIGRTPTDPESYGGAEDDYWVDFLKWVAFFDC